MVGETIVAAIQESVGTAIQSVVLAMPRVVAAIIVLVIGYAIGKIISGIFRKALEKMDIGERLIKGTAVERFLDGANTTFERLIGALVAVFIYVAFILAAVDILKIDVLSGFVNEVLLYLPNLIAGILVLIVGLIAAEWLVSFVRGMTEEYNVPEASLVASAVKVILTLAVIVIALEQWQIQTSIVYTFLTPIAWGFAAAIAVAFGWGLKDLVSEWGKRKVEKWGK